MKTKFLFPIFALGLALLLGATRSNGTALAHHPNHTITFAYLHTATIDGGIEWRDEHGLHIRDRVDIGLLSGDVRGFARLVYNADLTSLPSRVMAGAERTFGEGVAYGTIEVFSSEHDLVVPLWSGSWTRQIHKGRVVGGSMTAYSLDGLLVLRIDSIRQSDTRGLLHTGVIDHAWNCLRAGCEPDAISTRR